MALQNAFENLAVESKQDTIITALATLLTELQQKIETGQAIALDASTLAALETITAVVSGTVALDSTTLAALETITATVSFPADFPDAAVLAKVEAVRGLLAGTLAVSGPLTNAELRATAVSVSGSLTDTELRASEVAVEDNYSGGEILAQQAGAGGVLTFTFSAAVNLVVAESSGDGLVSRVDPFGGTPAEGVGWPARHETPNFMPVITTVVKVYAPSGASVNVMGYRR